MEKKKTVRLPSQGKVKREDYFVEGHLVETQRREPMEAAEEETSQPTGPSDSDISGQRDSSSVKADQYGGGYDE